MFAKTYLWIEDRVNKSSYIFWTTLMRELCPEVIVESKNNNRELVKAVKGLSDKENRYIVLFDNSFDNVQIYMEQKKLKQAASGKDNVFLLNFICFEYILLEFDKLIDWIYEEDDEFLEKRTSAIKARKLLLEALQSDNFNYKDIREVVNYDKNIDNHNIEQLSAKLLLDLTRNTGFEVSKGKIGPCWVKSCCEWIERQADDVCGLDEKKISVKEKMQQIFYGTSLHKEFSNIELEVSV